MITEEPKMSRTDRLQRNQYLREFLPAIVSYGVILSVVMALVDESSPSARYWLLLPVVPLVGVMVAVYRSVQRSDEYSRLVQLEAMSVGFGAALVTSLIFGFLGVAGVSTTYAGFVVFGAAMGTWGLTVGLRGIRD